MVTDLGASSFAWNSFVPPLALALRMSSPEISGCDIVINVSCSGWQIVESCRAIPELIITCFFCAISDPFRLRFFLPPHISKPVLPPFAPPSLSAPKDPLVDSGMDPGGVRAWKKTRPGTHHAARSLELTPETRRRIHAWWKLGKAERVRNRTVAYTTAPGAARY